MARPLRIEFENAWYHVMNRGRNHMDIFRGEHDYRVFLEILTEACGLFNVQIASYCLMSNHYHLLIHTPEANLSRFMRHIDGVYTQKYNRSYQKDGSLFKGRYRAVVLQVESYLLRVMRYIHLNPVQARIVHDPTDYPWSSHRDYISVNGHPSWLLVGFILNQFSSQSHLAAEAYNQFITAGIDSETEKFYSQVKLKPIYADATRTAEIKEKYLAPNTREVAEIPERRKIRGEQMASHILRAVSQNFSVAAAGIKSSRRGKENLPRQMAIALARELSGMTHRQIADFFNINSYKTVNKHCDRFASKIRVSDELSEQYKQLRSTCLQVET
ncbi:MAG: transposase [Candidatus Omnitrophota bacterium]|nr:transposase [Candidatus Omnitrophota bacterium]